MKKLGWKSSLFLKIEKVIHLNIKSLIKNPLSNKKIKKKHIDRQKIDAKPHFVSVRQHI